MVCYWNCVIKFLTITAAIILWFQCENIFSLYDDCMSSEKEISQQSDLRSGSTRYKRYHLAIYSARYRNPAVEIPSGFAWRQKRAVPICWISAKNAAVLAETCRGKHKRWDFVHTLRFQAHVKGSTPDRRLANDTWCRSCAKSTGNPEKELYLLERSRTVAVELDAGIAPTTKGGWRE